jgi:hypothetical protein
LKIKKIDVDKEICVNCANGIDLEDGGILCDMDNRLVIDDYEWTEDYMWCDGKYFKRK